MKDLRKLMKLALLLAVSFSISNTSTGQCTTWKDLEAGSVEKEAAEANYQIYKDHLKEKNYPASMIAWEKLRYQQINIGAHALKDLINILILEIF